MSHSGKAAQMDKQRRQIETIQAQPIKDSHEKLGAKEKATGERAVKTAQKGSSGGKKTSFGNRH